MLHLSLCMRIFLIAVFFISSHFIAAQQTDIIDIKRVEANLDLDFYYKTVDGDLSQLTEHTVDLELHPPAGR